VPEIGGRRPDLPEGMGGQLGPFAAIGILCTLLYVVGFNVLRTPLGVWPANVVALTATMILNTAANRRFTFGRRGRRDLGRHYLEAGAVYVVGLVVSSIALAAVDLLVASPSALVQTLALLAAGAVATVVRFVGMRSWIFHPGRAAR
jgi:putative flippase GtrA